MSTSLFRSSIVLFFSITYLDVFSCFSIRTSTCLAVFSCNSLGTSTCLALFYFISLSELLMPFLTSSTNIMTKKQVGEEMVYSAYTSTLLFITKGSQDWNSHRAVTWRQELMQRPWRNVPYWLASPGLLSLLSYRTKTTSPGMAPPILSHP